MVRKPRAIDLFAGAGGLTEGLKQAGCKVVGAVELDTLACRAYRMNHPRVVLQEGDIRELDPKVILDKVGLQPGELDLLAACPPCQGFSSMRTLNGSVVAQDERNDLVISVADWVREIQPVSLMLENVPGLRSDERFEKVVRRLRRMGYSIAFDVLNTVHFGVPQRRRRLVVLGSKVVRPTFADREERWHTVRDAIAKVPKGVSGEDPLHCYRVEREPRIEEMIKAIPLDGGSRSALGEQGQLRCHRDFDGFNDVYGRMAWDRPAPTITSGCINPSKGRFLHPVEHRAITLREAALLQTFPASYQFPLERGKYAVASMIGNALPPEFVRRHAAALLKQVRDAHCD